jgi:predicted dehydrogenase
MLEIRLRVIATIRPRQRVHWEKPIAATLDFGRAVISAREETGVLLQISLVCRCAFSCRLA